MKLTLLTSILFLISVCSLTTHGQDKDAISQLYNETLQNGKAYSWLEYLTQEVGSRLSGSAGAAEAVQWSKEALDNIADSVWLQPVMVPHWVRGQKEVAYIKGQKKKDAINLNVCALGGSIGTGPDGITGTIIEVKSFDELKQLGEKHVKGKIVFFNRPLEATQIQTFVAYVGAVEQRARGASEAAKYGAIGVIVRSMTLSLDDYPHTGGMRYLPDVPKIPAIAVSTKHAELLSAKLKSDKTFQVYFETHCETLPDVPSSNVIAEIYGSEYRDEIIVVSGHLDSWDLGQGAHDDGAGCVQSMEVLRLFKVLGMKPKRTIRVVLYMNEENGVNGGKEYAKQAELKREKHIAAIESDDGGFTPRGFSMTSSDAFRSKVKSWRNLLEPYGLTDFDGEGHGTDITPLEPMKIPLLSYLPDSQRYFDYHHTAKDTFENINKRELELGAGGMAALIFLIDKYGAE